MQSRHFGCAADGDGATQALQSSLTQRPMGQTGTLFIEDSGFRPLGWDAIACLWPPLAMAYGRYRCVVPLRSEALRRLIEIGLQCKRS
jgi:hypothetical protein